MKKRLKGLLCVWLAIAMLIGMWPMTALALVENYEIAVYKNEALLSVASEVGLYQGDDYLGGWTGVDPEDIINKNIYLDMPLNEQNELSEVVNDNLFGWKLWKHLSSGGIELVKTLPSEGELSQSDVSEDVFLEPLYAKVAVAKNKTPLKDYYHPEYTTEKDLKINVSLNEQEDILNEVPLGPGYVLDGWKLWRWGSSGVVYEIDGVSPKSVESDYAVTSEDVLTIGSEYEDYRLVIEPFVFLKYKIDPQPDDETFTVGAKEYNSALDDFIETDDATYQWHEYKDNIYAVVGDGESGENLISVITLWKGDYSGENTWTTDDYLDMAFPVEAGDVIQVIPVGDVDGEDTLTVKEYFGSDFEYDEENGLYTQTISDSNDHYNLYIEGMPVQTNFKIQIIRPAIMDAVSGQTDKTLTDGTDGKKYVCKVTFNPAGDNVTVTSDAVTWKILPSYTVSFDANGGEGEMENQTINLGATTALSENTFTNSGYSFGGWNTKSDGSGTPYADKASVKDIAASGETVTLYAIWNEKGTVSLNEAAQLYQYDGNVKAFEIKGTNLSDFTVSYKKDGNDVVEPRSAGTYDVIIERAEDGDYNAFAKTITGGLVIEKAIPEQNPEKLTKASVKKGKKLSDANVREGEFFAVDGTTVLDGTYTWVDDSETITSNTTKKMLFTPDDSNYAAVEFDVDVVAESNISVSSGDTTRYYVSFESNGGSAVKSATVTRNGKLTEPANPTKDGFEFAGWFKDKELTEAYDFSKYVTESFVLYAKWNGITSGDGPSGDEPSGDKPNDDDKGGIGNHNCSSKQFDDLDITAWYHIYTDFVLDNEIFKGVEEKIFAPDLDQTRAMMVTVLYRAEGEPATNRSIPFADVDMGAYYANAVIWAHQNGIVNGYSETEFGPNDKITREQIATIMYRYAIYKGMDVMTLEDNLHFEDADEISEYAVSAMNWAVGKGILKGRTETKLYPKENATRVEIAAILYRFIKGNG